MRLEEPQSSTAREKKTKTAKTERNGLLRRNTENLGECDVKEIKVSRRWWAIKSYAAKRGEIKN